MKRVERRDRKSSIVPLLLLAACLAVLLAVFLTAMQDHRREREEAAFLELFYDGDYQGFITEYQQLDEVRRVREAYLYLYGISCYSLGDYDAVIDSLTLFNMLYPVTSESLPLLKYLLGASYFFNAAYDEALVYLQSAAAAGYDSVKLQLLIGLAAGFEGSYGEAKQHLLASGLSERQAGYFLLDRYIELGETATAVRQVDSLLRVAADEQEVIDLHRRKAGLESWDDVTLYSLLAETITDSVLLHDIYLELAAAYEGIGNLIEARSLRVRAADLVR